jgi:mono/diheme cytochrome c family protein
MKARQLTATGLALVTAATLRWSAAQPEGHSHPSGTPPHDHPPAPIRITPDALHGHGGVPMGWRFTFPTGDAKAGREVFAKLECYKCHRVEGAGFPETPARSDEVGPELTGMGDRHPAEYFAESILNPNAVILEGPGYTGPDGLSIMPDYRESLTVSELIDLVAYLRSLGPGDGQGPDRAGPPVRDKVVGDLRVRVEYDHMAGQEPGPGGAGRGAGARRPGHLMVFVANAQSGEPIPYLPVGATIYAERQAPKRTRLVPMLGPQGFHYGADVTLPQGTAKVTVTIGTPVMRLMPAVAGRFANSRQVSFDWSDTPSAHHH